MYLQQTSRNNPYAAFTNFVQNRGLFHGKHPLVPLSSEDMRLSNLIAPALQSQMLYQADQYDGLAAQLSTISQSLNRLTQAANPFIGSGNGFEGTGSQGVIVGALPISLSRGSVGSTAAMTLGEVGLNTSSIIAATFAKLNSGSIALNLSNAIAGTSAVISTGSVQLNPSIASPATTATLNGGSISLNTSNATAATYATLTGSSLALNLNNTTAATAATFTTGNVSLNSTASTPATYAKLLTSSVQMISSTTATLTTGPVAISAGTSATMNNGGGVKLNSTGATDLGSVTIDGVTNTFGSFTGTLTGANNLIVNTINSNGSNDVTASVNKNGQIILTSKTAGSTSTIAITSSTSNANGFKVGTAVGSGNASTDLGSVTINGVTTNFGLISNAGLTTQSAAQYIVSQINGNSANTVTASVGGNQNNSIILTSKTAGSAGNFTINAATNESDGLSVNNGSNGFVAGTTATGTGAASTDLGTATIAGVKVTFGSLSNTQYNAQSAAQYMVNTINATKGITVTASVGGANNDQILLTSKTAGTAGDFTYSSTSDSNKNLSDDGVNGFATATYTAGQNAVSGQTDFGSLTVNGVTTTFGLFANTGQTNQTATQWMVDQINANSANTVTASVTGANKDQILLTAKTTGSAGNFTVNSSNDSNGSATDNGVNGFATGTYKAATDYNAGSTDFGSMTINGVTTNLGLFNNNGQTTQTAAQWLVNRLNANSANTVTASVGGANNDQVVLTAKTAGTAGNFTINTATNDSNSSTADDGSNGFTTGSSATGQNADAGKTDFGSVNINGVVTTFGMFDNNGQTVQTATQWLVNQLNANANNIVTASVGGTNHDQLVLTAKQSGSAGNFTINSASNDSNSSTADDGNNGLVTGNSATGQDAVAGQTDFGSVTVNGVTTNFGLFNNAGQTAQTAAQWLVNKLNGNSANTFTAAVGGANNDQIVLTDKTTGTNLTVQSATNDSNNNSADDGKNGFIAGATANGQPGNAGKTDFGSVTINGVVTNFGLFDNNGQTVQTATQWLVNQLNANSANTVTASVTGSNNDQILLTSKTLGSAGNFSINAATDNSDAYSTNDGSNGFVAGNSAAGTDAYAGTSDFGSVTINGVTTNFGVLSNQGLTAQSAAQYLIGQINGNQANTVTASVGGAYHDQIILTAKQTGAAGNFTINAVGSDSDGITNNAAYTGFSAGASATGSDGALGQTDFGSITINGITTQFGALDNSKYTPMSAAQYLASQLNATNPTVLATVDQQGRLMLQSADFNTPLRIDAVQSDASGVNRLGFAPGQVRIIGSSEAGAGTPAGQGAMAVTTGSGGGETVIGTGQGYTQGVLSSAHDFANAINQYLQDLSAPGAQSLGLSKRYADEIVQAVTQPDSGLSNLGFGVANGQVQVDEAKLQAALDSNPDQVYATLSQAQQALSGTVSEQQVSFEDLRQSAIASSQNAEDISKVSVSLFRVDQQTRSLSYLMDSLSQATDNLKSQKDQLDKQKDALSTGTEDSSKKPPKDKTTDPNAATPSATTPDANADKPSSIKSFGLLKSPVADFINNGNFFTP